MNEVLLRLLWVLVAAALIAYVTSLFLGSVIEAQNTKSSVTVTDRVSAGVHHLSGLVSVPSPCHGLSVRVEEVSFSLYHLRFLTWKEPYRDCDDELAFRNFHVVTFAPALGTQFTASLDDKSIPLHVINLFQREQR